MASVTVETDCVLTDEVIEAARAELVETDGEPLESPWHRSAINLLIDIVNWRWRGRTDYFVGGNMFIYYSRTQARERKYKGPDFFFVNHVDGARPRPYWWVFEEDGRFPDVIMELSSPTTIKEDHTTKKDLYEREFRTPEYFCYDPDTRILEGWRLKGDAYQTIEPNERGWLWSEQLDAWVGLWDGDFQRIGGPWPRLFGKDGNLLLVESEDLQRRLQSEKEEVARLKALLAAKGVQPDNGQS